jgi:hypothetical protein
MFDGLKTSVAVLLGLLIGVAVAMPLAWYGTRLGADSLAHNIDRDLGFVEERQQAMADQALRLEELLVQKGDHEGAPVFEQVMDARSRLAGVAPLADKLAAVQALEQTLLLSEKVWEQAGSKSAVRSSFYYGEHGRVWEKQKRLLVREQQGLVDSVVELNRLLDRWPASVLLGYKSFGALLNALFGDVLGNGAYVARIGVDWIGYGARKLAALSSQQAPPEPPKWERPKGAKAIAYMDPMVVPRFLADAPPPEDEYRELQYTHETRDYADVDLGEDKAVLENRSAPQGYHVVLPTPQTTVSYR